MSLGIGALFKKTMNMKHTWEIMSCWSMTAHQDYYFLCYSRWILPLLNVKNENVVLLLFLALSSAAFFYPQLCFWLWMIASNGNEKRVIITDIINESYSLRPPPLSSNCTPLHCVVWKWGVVRGRGVPSSSHYKFITQKQVVTFFLVEKQIATNYVDCCVITWNSESQVELQDRVWR